MSKIRQYRESVGLSQVEFAKALNVGKSTISRIESGQRTPSVALVTRICELSNGVLTADDVIAPPLAPKGAP